jgi:hypothetical protein
MNRKRKAVACAVILLFLAWIIFPWVVPSYSHNLVMSVQLLPGKVPTYEVQLLDLTPWPATLTDAQWLVTHGGLYNYWVPSEPPKQVLLLLPLQSHAFQFTIYNGTATTVSNYYNGPLVVELRATIQVLGTSSPIRIQSGYNSTFS